MVLDINRLDFQHRAPKYARWNQSLALTPV